MLLSNIGNYEGPSRKLFHAALSWVLTARERAAVCGSHGNVPVCPEGLVCQSRHRAWLHRAKSDVYRTDGDAALYSVKGAMKERFLDPALVFCLRSYAALASVRALGNSRRGIFDSFTLQ